MKAKSLAKANKSKNFTFRITNALSNDIASVKAKSDQCGLRLNMTEALTAALVKELKAVEKDLQKIDPNWTIGQLELDVECADAQTK